MTAQVAVVLNQARQALCIPLSALGDKKDGRCTVKVLKGESVERRSIRTGITDNVQIQVVEGLAPGEKVVVGDSSMVPATTTSQQMGPPPGRH